jgi:hypothetical protein
MIYHMCRCSLKRTEKTLTICPFSALDFDFDFPGLGFGNLSSFFFFVKLGNRLGNDGFTTKHDGVMQDICAGCAQPCNDK